MTSSALVGYNAFLCNFKLSKTIGFVVGFCNCSMVLYVHSSVAIILMGKGELVAMLS